METPTAKPLPTDQTTLASGPVVAVIPASSRSGWTTSEHAFFYLIAILSSILLFKWGPQMWAGVSALSSMPIAYGGWRTWAKRPVVSPTSAFSGLATAVKEFFPNSQRS